MLAEAGGKVGSLVKDTGVNPFSQVGKTLAPVVGALMGVVKPLVIAGVPLLILAAVLWGLFVRWSQHGADL